MNNEFTMSLTSNFGLAPDKVGLTTTVKEQVQHIEMTIEHFKKCIDSQRKQQSEIQNQLINLQKDTENNLKSMLNEISLYSKQLIQSFSLGSEKQNKQIEYLTLQRKIVTEEQQKLAQLSGALNERVLQMQESVGM